MRCLKGGVLSSACPQSANTNESVGLIFLAEFELVFHLVKSYDKHRLLRTDVEQCKGTPFLQGGFDCEF